MLMIVSEWWMSKQIKATSYNPFRRKIVQINESMYSVLDELISYSFLMFLEQVGAEFNFVTGQVLASLNQLLIKKV